MIFRHGALSLEDPGQPFEHLVESAAEFSTLSPGDNGLTAMHGEDYLHLPYVLLFSEDHFGLGDARIVFSESGNLLFGACSDGIWDIAVACRDLDSQFGLRSGTFTDVL